MKTANYIGLIALCAMWSVLGNDAVAGERYNPGDTIVINTCCDMKIGWDVVGRVHRGHTYNVLQVQGDWLWIKNNGQKGWINTSYVRPFKPVPRLKTQIPFPPDGPQVFEIMPDGTRVPVDINDPQSFTNPPIRVFPKVDPPIIIGPKEEETPPSQESTKITVWGKDFQIGGGTTQMNDGSIIIGGGVPGPHGGGGSAQCQVQLPDDASKLTLSISLWHGTPGQFGKGIHSRVRGGTASVYVNNVLVHTFTCQHQHKFGDWWPDPRPELGHSLPNFNAGAQRIRGRTVTIKITVSPWTCMDLRALNVKPVSQSDIIRVPTE